MTEPTLSPSRRWKRMTAEQRMQAARAFWTDEQATDDQVVNVRARLNSIGTTTSGSHWIGAMVRYTDPSNYYYVTLRTSNELSLRKIVDGVVTELDREPFTMQFNQYYRLRIEAIGTKLVVYLNDTARLQASDSSHPQGRSGVITYRAAASFSGYSAWQP